MAHLLGGEGIHLAYPHRVVLSSVTLGINEGDRIGIVGRNGDGKSSLVRILSGKMNPHEGRITRRGGITVGVLDQNDTLDPQASVAYSIVGDMPEHEWAGQAHIREVIEGLVTDVSWDARISTLSGGQRRRVALAALLAGQWDILMLDEPTNHLDVEGITWLARHLKNRWAKNAGGLVVITHDRWFLDEVALTTWEVHDGVVEPFDGGYAAYVLQRVERDRQAAAAQAKRQNVMRKELAWLRRGAPARTSKPKFRIEAANALIADVPEPRNKLELNRLAVARLGKDVIDLLDVGVVYDVDISTKLSGTPAQIPQERSASLSYDGTTVASHPSQVDRAGQAQAKGQDEGKEVLREVTWRIAPGERTAIMGANGAGKSTLLGLMTGTISPTSGRVKRGKTVRVAILDQEFSALALIGGDLVRDVLARHKTMYRVADKEFTPAQLLERLGFAREHLCARVDELSGGQKRRLQLLLVLLSEPNVLILDEPSNDVDTDMLAAMEDLLDSWPGTLIVVSHDRYFVERVTDQQYAIVEGRLRHLPGGVDEYVQLSQALKSSARGKGRLRGEKGNAKVFSSRAQHSFNGAFTGTPTSATSGVAPSTLDTSRETSGAVLSGADAHAARKKAAAIERKIDRINSELAAVHQRMAEHDPSDFMGLAELADTERAMRENVAALEEEWFEVSALLE